jgi:hypothetical protein
VTRQTKGNKKTVSRPPAKRRKAAARRVEAALDEALEETFPASDPVEMTEPPRKNGRPRRGH